MVSSHHISLTIACFILHACNSGGGSVSPSDSSSNPKPENEPATDTQQYTELSVRSLDADGFEIGLSAYDLIRNFAGSNPIEAPDLYAVNHPGIEHIYEDTNIDIGNHFVFTIHRDIDIDRDKTSITDRQRNEIKAYSGSENALKGFENDSFIYTWKFKINTGMEISRNFTHFFQLKAVGGIDSHPILTITGAERSGSDGIEVRHSPLQRDTILQRTGWNRVTGVWIEVYCRATFSDSGTLRLIATRLVDNAIIFDINASNLDLWRGEDSSHFVRPKWGIYRSLRDANNLRPEEETVAFANFEVKKIVLQ